jgi:hypothetical protein
MTKLIPKSQISKSKTKLIKTDLSKLLDILEEEEEK